MIEYQRGMVTTYPIVAIQCLNKILTKGPNKIVIGLVVLIRLLHTYIVVTSFFATLDCWSTNY